MARDIQFYESEIGIDMIFDLVSLADDGCTLEPFPDAPSLGWPKLIVSGLAASPITLDATVVPAQYHHKTVANEWPVNDPTEVIHYYTAYIEWKDATQKFFSDAFKIAVMAAPSLSL